ncbi:Putative uncharacterized transketolase family protein y4mO [Pseudomonas sp. 9AZ]|uniref:transketolase n=1 Tax=Pseudomonas sp. 9AZ TaxID=2653168 RepID=UPI0012F2CF84|nr:transketolase [Pseudomonas sp. 9AZ]VXD04479.1 Putative uncharacterized transketolase family protein y4mO [Pseudomonas sp. 9AZ]
MSQDIERLNVIAKQLRRHVLAQAIGAGQGYVGQGLQSADLFTALFFHEMHWSKTLKDDPRRDRFLLSTGHYAIALYAAFAEAGLVAHADFASYGQDGSALTLGAEPGHVPGVEFAGGSLGQGLGVAAGLAWGLRFNRNPARVFNYMSDGEVQEGSTWEAAMLAGAQNLGNLINIVDVNRTQADGPLVLEIEPLAEKFRAFGWWVAEVNGNDMAELVDVFARVREDATNEPSRPKVIIAHTRLGYGAPSIMESEKAHFVRINDEQWQRVAAEVEAFI